MAGKFLGKRSITVDVPIGLFNMYAKLCVDAGISKTEGFLRYLEYLASRHQRQRELVNELSNTTFILDEGKPK
jgi:hypothetical protein